MALVPLKATEKNLPGGFSPGAIHDDMDLVASLRSCSKGRGVRAAMTKFISRVYFLFLFNIRGFSLKDLIGHL